MAAYTLILRSKLLTLIDFTVEDLVSVINEDETQIEYFGEEIDNPFDYQYDEGLNIYINKHSFITFNFDTKHELSYKNIDAKEYALNFLRIKSVRIIREGKDIEVFQD